MPAYTEGLPAFHFDGQLDIGRSSDLHVLSVQPHEVPSSVRRGSLYRRRPSETVVDGAPSWSVCRLARETRWFDDLRVSDRLAVRHRRFGHLMSRSRRATSLARPRYRDDTRVSSSFSLASFRRAHMDGPAWSNASRQLHRRSSSRRRLNDQHPLNIAS